ncbi:MAG: hypothetical protein R3E83_00835 [Burkholderiaceae bacterium]
MMGSGDGALRCATWVAWLDRWLLNAAAGALVGLVLYVMVAILGAWAGWSVPDELLIVAECMVPLVFFPMARVVRGNGHLAVNYVASQGIWHPVALAARRWAIWCLGLLFHLTLLFASAIAFWEAAESGATQMGVLEIPTMLSRGALLAGVALASVAQVLSAPRGRAAAQPLAGAGAK